MARFPSCHLSGSRGASASPRWVSMFVDEQRSIIMSPVDFCDGNFSITFTRIPILFFFHFPFFFSPLPPAKGCGAARIDFRFQFNGVVVSEPRSSNTNFALSASARRRWLPSCQTPFARSSKSPEEKGLRDSQNAMMAWEIEGKVQVVPARSTRFLGIQLLLLRCVLGSWTRSKRIPVLEYF